MRGRGVGVRQGSAAMHRGMAVKVGPGAARTTSRSAMPWIDLLSMAMRMSPSRTPPATADPPGSTPLRHPWFQKACAEHRSMWPSSMLLACNQQAAAGGLGCLHPQATHQRTSTTSSFALFRTKIMPTPTITTRHIRCHARGHTPMRSHLCRSSGRVGLFEDAYSNSSAKIYSIQRVVSFTKLANTFRLISHRELEKQRAILWLTAPGQHPIRIRRLVSLASSYRRLPQPA